MRYHPTVTEHVHVQQLNGELLVLFACSIVSCFIGYSYEKTVNDAWRVVNSTLRQVGSINGDGFLRGSDKSSSLADAVWNGKTTSSAASLRLSKAKSSGDALTLRHRSDLSLLLDGSLSRRNLKEISSREDEEPSGT